jgi:uncharacterized Zn finger protein (UPF0148 family)
MAVWDNTAQTSLCPSCGSPVRFDALSGRVACTMCGNTYEPGTLNLLRGLEVRDKGESTAEDERRHEIVCDSCGAVMVTDNNTSASFCAFCGSPKLIVRRLTREFRPDEIIPFKITKDEAKKRFLEWSKNCRYAPNDFTSKHNVEKLTGIYVPFWLIDATCHSSVLGTGWEVYGETLNKTEAIYSLSRDIKFDVKKVPFDGSKHISDRLMEAIEPFDYNDLKPFSDDYIPGYYAERYDISAVDMADRIEERLKSYGGQLMGYTESKFDKVEYNLNDSYIEAISQTYALLPIWFMNYRYDGLNYSFAVNGQTGEVAGDIPFSKYKRFFAVLKVMWHIVLFAFAVMALLIYIILITGISRFSIGLTVVAPYYIIKYFYPKFADKIRDTAFYATNPIDPVPKVEVYYDTEKKAVVEEDSARPITARVFTPHNLTEYKMDLEKNKPANPDIG